MYQVASRHQYPSSPSFEGSDNDDSKSQDSQGWLSGRDSNDDDSGTDYDNNRDTDDDFEPSPIVMPKKWSGMSLLPVFSSPEHEVLSELL